jgi:hypothetical protein
MPSGYNPDFPDDVILDVGVLTHEVAAAQVPIGVTRGGTAFKKNTENRQIPADGLRVPIAGLDRNVGGRPEFSGTLLQFPTAIVDKFEAGSTAVTDAGPPEVTTITPIDQGTTIVKDKMLVKPTLTYRRGNGGTFAIEFPLGLVMNFDINAQDKNEGEIPYTIESRLDPDAVGFTTDDPGYTYVLTGPAA